MLKENLKVIFKPTMLQLLLCLLASILIMVVVYWDTILNILTTWSRTDPSRVHTSFFSYLSSFGDLPFTSNIFIILFWGILAALVYAAGLVIVNVLIDMRNSVVIKTEFTKPPGAGGALKHLITQVIAAVILIILLVICGLIIFPFFVQMAGVALDSGMAWSSVAQGAGAILGTAASLYLIWSLTQIVFTLL